MKPYACHNRGPLGSKVIPMQDGWFLDGVTRAPRLVPLQFRMSRECQYTSTELGQADRRCEGCKWRANA